MSAASTVFLAGAAGAIGRRLCPLLREDGWRVVGTTRSNAKAGALRALGVEPVVVDVFDAAALRAAVAQSGASAVIHQLTDLPQLRDPASMAAALGRNARLRELGTRNLVAAALAAGAKRFVAQSIAFAYAPGPKPYAEDAPLNVSADDPAAATSARGVASLEQQVLAAPFEGIVLRYGRLYGPGTWYDSPPAGAPVHVDAAADAARRALRCGEPGIYNVAESDGTVTSEKARRVLGWSPAFRLAAPQTGT
jgi:nucleoside-diphosphate-sugar epimerase